jgi:hypothetical protein
LKTELTGSKPALNPDTTSLAGLSHNLAIRTAYYTADVPIWIDSIPEAEAESEPLPEPDPPASKSQPPTTTILKSPDRPSASPTPPSPWADWASPYCAPEATEVLTSLGAVIAVFRKPCSPAEFSTIKDLLTSVQRVVRACSKEADGLDGDWDGVCLAVGMKRKLVGGGFEVGEEEWEDVCAERGFEFVDGEVGLPKGGAKGKRNEFGEFTGLARLREALEANDWSPNVDLLPTALDDDEDDEERLTWNGDENVRFDDDTTGFGEEAAELEMEMFGMKRAILEMEREDEHEGAGRAASGQKKDEETEEDQVEVLESLILRMQAVKETGAGMSEAARKRFAARAVQDIMRSL